MAGAAGGHVGLALFAANGHFGVFHAADVPAWLAVAVTFVLFDLTQRLVHFALHKVPLLWCIHRLHHSDDTIDAATALRFHPVETLLRFLALALVIVLLGAPVSAVVAAYLATMLFDVWSMRTSACLDGCARNPPGCTTASKHDTATVTSAPSSPLGQGSPEPGAVTR